MSITQADQLLLELVDAYPRDEERTRAAVAEIVTSPARAGEALLTLVDFIKRPVGA